MPRLATLLRGRLSDGDRAALEERLADPKVSGEGRGNLLFGLAHVLDGRGDYARAADCLREANALALEHAKRRHRDYDPAQHEQFVDNMLEASDAAFFARTADGGSDTRRPVFVFGLPRSGTTLIEQMLASHSRIHGAGELRLVRRSFESIPTLLGRSDWPIHCLPHLDAAAVRLLAEQHLQWLHEHNGGKTERIVDKMPDNYLYLGLLAALFPNAVFIHCRRDLRDVAVSCWMTNFRSIPLGQRSRTHRHALSRVSPADGSLASRAARAAVTSRLRGYGRATWKAWRGDLVTACGLEWEPACLEFHRTRAAGPHRQHHAGSPTHLHAIGRPLAEL